jgi:predicted MFS family arabinose efflux permease
MGARYADRALSTAFGEDAEILRDVELQIAVLASSILAVGTTLLSPLISDLAGVFGVSERVSGLLIIVYLVTATVCIPIGGILADRLGRTKLLVSGLVLFGLAGAGITLTTSFAFALGLRVVQALGFSAAVPVTITIFSELYEGRQEATGQGMRAAGINIAIMIVPFVSGLLFTIGWYLPFAIYLVAIPVAMWAWAVLPESRSPNETPFSVYLSQLFELCRDVAVFSLLISFVVRFFILYGFYTYISVLLVREVGTGVVLAGGIVSLKGVFSTISSTQAGRLSTVFDTAVVVIGGFGLTGLGIGLLGAAPVLEGVVLGTILFGLGDGIIAPSQKSLVTQLSPPDLRGGTVSLATALQNAGKTLGPIALAVTFGMVPVATSFFLFGIASGIAGAVLILVVFRSTRYQQYRLRG